MRSATFETSLIFQILNYNVKSMHSEIVRFILGIRRNLNVHPSRISSSIKTSNCMCKTKHSIARVFRTRSILVLYLHLFFARSNIIKASIYSPGWKLNIKYRILGFKLIWISGENMTISGRNINISGRKNNFAVLYSVRIWN
jgi:hypothetical protein